MNNENLSQKLCEICGIEPIKKTLISCGCEDRTRHFRSYDPKRCRGCKKKYKAKVYKEVIKLIYPDFEKPENYKKLQEVFINNEHSITLSEGWYAISNGDTDFIYDMHDTTFALTGKTFLKAVCNYLSLWYEQTTRYKLEDNTFGPLIDTSHTLTRGECIYPRGYDDLLKSVEQIKLAIKNEEWVYG